MIDDRGCGNIVSENRNRIKINWKFDRKAARRKFNYKKNSSQRSKT